MLDAAALAAALVETPSLSGAEGAACEVVARAIAAAGLEPRRWENNVWCERGSGARALLFNSHLDTVPAGPGWTRDPHRAAIEGDRLYGLGSTDAKSCVAAMLAAFVAAPDPGPRGRLVFAATAEEETGGTSGGDGLERLLPSLGALAAGVIGEPTGLAICDSQRGLVRAVLRAEGRAGHASRPREGVNAIEIAAEDVLALRALAAEIDGTGATIQATMIAGGTKANVIPARCETTLDVRTTPAFDNERAVDAIGAAVKARLEVRSARFRPVALAPDAAIRRAARRALPEADVRPFGGVSDLFFLAKAGVPGVIVGPGDGAQSHQADEWVSVDAVRRGVDAYAAIVREFFAETGRHA
jgi:acetylornithine deacetylase